MKVTLKNVRMAFPHLFVAKASDEGQTPKFSAAFIFAPDHPAYAAVKAAEEAVGSEKWKEKWAATKKGIAAKDRMALHDGETKSQYDGYEGNFFVNGSNAVRPLVIDRDKSPLAAQDGKLYAGCYVNVILDIWAQDNTYGKAINCSLSGVQFVADGESFAAGGAASADEFEEEDGDDELV